MTTIKPVYTDAQVVGSLTNTGGAVWKGSTISYNFPATLSGVSGISQTYATQQAMASYWMNAWDDLIAPSLVRVADNVHASISVVNSATVAYASATRPNMSAGAKVYLNVAADSSWGSNDLITPVLGQWGAQAIGHEIGHALGLSHPGAYNGGAPTYQANAQYVQDSLQYTVMSYFSPSETGADWVASDGNVHFAQTPMMNDIMAIQKLYGADTKTRATDC